MSQIPPEAWDEPETWTPDDGVPAARIWDLGRPRPTLSLIPRPPTRTVREWFRMTWARTRWRMSFFFARIAGWLHP